jgi:uncharacterized protein YjbI with pentapeptide repeats
MAHGRRGRPLEGVELEGVELEGVELEGVELEGVELEGVELEGVELEKTAAGFQVAASKKKARTMAGRSEWGGRVIKLLFLIVRQ